MQLEINKLSPNQRNFVLAALLGHEWRCPWMLAQDGYTRWQSYESAWGNPTPDYCNDQRVTGNLIDEYLISAYPNFYRDNSGNYDGWIAAGKKPDKQCVVGMGKNRLEAVAACLIKMFAKVPNRYVQIDDHADTTREQFVTIPDQLEGV